MFSKTYTKYNTYIYTRNDVRVKNVNLKFIQPVHVFLA